MLVGVLTIVFFLIRLSGDPALLFLPAQATPRDVAIYKHVHGLDRPLPVQYGYFLADAAHGDFGRSLRFDEPALPLVLSRLPATLLLAACAALVGLALSVPLAILAAIRRGRLADALALLTSLLGQSFPQFWLGLMLILLLAVRVHAFPPSGSGGIQYLVLPSLTLGIAMAALLVRLLRANLIEVLGQDYIRTGRAKGLGAGQVVRRHALKNAALPSLTVFGLQLGLLISNAVVVEFVFGYPGIGRLALTAINQRDYPVVLAFIFVVGLIYALLNLVVDLLYTWLDPRIRLAPT